MDASLPVLRDRTGRQIENLRISVTDRCNFRCHYCLPEDGIHWLPRDHILSFEEIIRVARVFVEMGIRRVRITGGEPLVRRDLPLLVGMLRDIEGLTDLSLTTNGVFLDEQAEDLRRAGLRRINVSLDALTRDTFREMARRDALDRVMRGLLAAAELFEGPVKVNAVLIRGVNDGQIPDFVHLAREHGFEVRFIEFMPLDAHGSWSRDQLIPGREVLEAISRTHEMVPDPACPPTSPSRDYIFADATPGKIGCIDTVTSPFCDHCNRVRLTADGKLRTCLFSERETDLMSLLRGEEDRVSSDHQLRQTILGAVWNKEPGHRIGQPDFIRSDRSMSQIGG